VLIRTVTVRGVRSIIAVIIVVVLYVTGAKIVQIERNTKGKLVFLYLLYLASRTATVGSEMQPIFERATLKVTKNPHSIGKMPRKNLLLSM
jgi:hypothetical protein